MCRIYLVQNERRKIPSVFSKNQDSDDPTNRRENYSFSVDRTNLIMESKIKEQEQLWNQLDSRDRMKMGYMKLAFGIFSIFRNV